MSPHKTRAAVSQLFDNPSGATWAPVAEVCKLVENIDFAENAGYKKLSVIETKGFTLRSILEEYFIGGCDLLLIDIEGSELDAILSGDFKEIEPGLLPSYILLEEDRSLQAVLVSEETRYLNSAGYEILYLLPTAVCYRLVK